LGPKDTLKIHESKGRNNKYSRRMIEVSKGGGFQVEKQNYRELLKVRKEIGSRSNKEPGGLVERGG